jgi:CHAD domain-containing protein
MNPEAAHLQQLTAKLRENLALCAVQGKQEPSVEAIHDVRTGTRRIEAMLDSLQNSPECPLHSGPMNGQPEGLHASEALSSAIRRWRKLLRKIRRSAGAVRDLDVHRDLLGDLLKEFAEQSSGENGVSEDSSPSAKEQPALHKQADDLDAWLKHTRHEQAQPLVKRAQRWADKLDRHFAALGNALESVTAKRGGANPAVSALEAFARLSHEMQQLHADNLHDFRKGAKKARYMAETAANDEHAGAVGKALKKLQDEIGDWHDWLVLSDEAHSALEDHGAELITHIEQECEQHYKSAMKTAERMRGRLMGEWQAASMRRNTRNTIPR